MAISLGESDSETDFELDDEIVNELLTKEAKIMWKNQFQHIVEFSEQLLPMALYEPMKWCQISICDCIKHVAKIEEIVRNMGNDTFSVFQQQLKHWERRQHSCISKSRIPYSTPLYRQILDIFYCIFFQNTELTCSEVRERIGRVCESQFGKNRLAHARLLVKLCVRQYSQIEDFLSVFPEIIRSESLAGLISSYLNPMVTNEREAVVGKIYELLSSPDYHENQLCLMLLTRDDCEFKHEILECLIKYTITDPEERSKAGTELARRVQGDAQNTTTRHRFKLILEAEPDLLVKACLTTEHLSTTLLSIIVIGLDIISEKVATKRANIYEDLKPPLFGENKELSLPVEYLRLMKRLNEVLSSCILLKKAMKSLKESRKRINTNFWVELFILLNENRKTCI